MYEYERMLPLEPEQDNPIGFDLLLFEYLPFFNFTKLFHKFESGDCHFSFSEYIACSLRYLLKNHWMKMLSTFFTCERSSAL